MTDMIIYDNRFSKYPIFTEADIVKVDFITPNKARGSTDRNICLTLHTGYNLVFPPNVWDRVCEDVRVLREFEEDDEDE